MLGLKSWWIFNWNHKNVIGPKSKDNNFAQDREKKKLGFLGKK